MLYIWCYNTTKYKNTSIYKTKEINAVCTPEYMTDEQREEFEKGAEAYLSFTTEDNRYMFVPVNLVIRISNKPIKEI